MEPVPQFTWDELITEVFTEEAEGLTIKEICLKKGVPPTAVNKARVRRQANDQVVLGKLEIPGKKSESSVGGRIMRVNCYRRVDGSVLSESD